MITLIVLAPILIARLPPHPRGPSRSRARFAPTAAATILTVTRRGFGFGRRRHRFGRGLLTILGLFALDQFFTNRRP